MQICKFEMKCKAISILICKYSLNIIVGLVNKNISINCLISPSPPQKKVIRTTDCSLLHLQQVVMFHFARSVGLVLTCSLRILSSKCDSLSSLLSMDQLSYDSFLSSQTNRVSLVVISAGENEEKFMELFPEGIRYVDHDNTKDHL